MEGKASDWRPGPTVCRCCLSEGCYKDISTEYFWMGKREVYSEMLSETLNVSIAYSQSGGPNSNSRLICEPCISRLRDASEFKRQVVDCEKTFMHHLDPGTSSKSREFAVESVGEVKIEVVKQEKDSISDDDFDDRPDFLDVDSDDDLDDQPLTKLASKIPKKESVDLLQLLDTSQITVKRKANLKLKAPPKKIVKKEVKPTASKAAPAKQAEKKKGVDDAGGSKAENENKTVKKRRHQVILDKQAKKERIMVLLKFSTLCIFKRKASLFICIYCGQRYADPAKFREHYIEHEDVKPAELSSVVSGTIRPDLLKADITDLRCKLCDTPIDTLEGLVIHLHIIHQKINTNLPLEEIGIIPYIMNLKDYKCAICSERFTDYQALNHHMNIHYPRFVCEQCGSGFATRMRLYAHVLTHEAKTFPCSACDKMFNSKVAMERHYAYLHMKVKTYSCPECPESFLNYLQRLKHLSSQHGINKEKYQCNSCSKLFATKTALSLHVRATHLKEKSNACGVCDATFFCRNGLKRHMVTHSREKKHECSVCQKSFGRKYTLEHHMRIHLNDMRYVCGICESSFDQKCSLQQHGETQHPYDPNPAEQYD